jgi:hypothetical protein
LSPGILLFALGGNEFFAAKVRAKSSWNLDGTISLLMIFQNCN